MTEEEQYYQRQQEEQYYSEHGACPNCNQVVHISDLGQEPDGKVCCVNCYQDYRNSLTNLPQSKVEIN